MLRTKSALASALLLFSFAGCANEPPPVAPVAPEQQPPPAPPPAPAPSPEKFDALGRAEFNALAAETFVPLFWAADKNGNGVIEPDELAVLWGVGGASGPFVQAGEFTPAFKAAYERMKEVKANGYLASGLSEAERRRRTAVIAELAQGRPSLVRSDFTHASEEDRGLVEHVIRIAALIERIYAKQKGVFGLVASTPADDPASRMLFYRNQSPVCEAPKTDKDPDCHATPDKPVKVVGLYPASVQKDPKYCETLEKRKDQKALLGPFTVVVEQAGELKAIPYSEAYKEEMLAISDELRAAADGIKSESEKPLKAYLLADAQAFRDNNWDPADEAWSKMSVTNSKFYVRVAPDEVYTDPCSHKGGFQVSFARINQDSLAWQSKLDPIKNDMEGELAKLAGPPYKARKVTFHLPDFIDMILNAGDARNATGGTIGESLPNWGPVAKEGRGRTVAMTNLGTDKDSVDALSKAVESLYCKSSMEFSTMDPAPGLMGTVLHEASHNLGPANEYKVRGKTDEETFGGPLASTLEELKAEVSANYFTDWLAKKGLVDAKSAAQGHVHEIAWSFGHIADGLYTAEGKIKPYSQLASIEMGTLVKAGALVWTDQETAANGKDTGCFVIHIDKYPAAIAGLAKTVLGIKGRGDKAAAEKLRVEFVDQEGEWKRLRGIIRDRWLRGPKASYVYAIDR